MYYRDHRNYPLEVHDRGAAPAPMRMTYALTKGVASVPKLNTRGRRRGTPVYVSCILHQSQISAPCNFSVITVITITVFYVQVYTPGHKLG